MHTIPTVGSDRLLQDPDRRQCTIESDKTDVDREQPLQVICDMRKWDVVNMDE